MKFKSVSELRTESKIIFQELEKEGEPLVIIHNSRPRGVLLPMATYEAMQEALEDKEDIRAFDASKSHRFEAASWDRYAEKRLGRRR